MIDSRLVGLPAWSRLCRYQGGLPSGQVTECVVLSHQYRVLDMRGGDKSRLRAAEWLGRRTGLSPPSLGLELRQDTVDDEDSRDSKTRGLEDSRTQGFKDSKTRRLVCEDECKKGRGEAGGGSVVRLLAPLKHTCNTAILQHCKHRRHCGKLN